MVEGGQCGSACLFPEAGGPSDPHAPKTVIAHLPHGRPSALCRSHQSLPLPPFPSFFPFSFHSFPLVPFHPFQQDYSSGSAASTLPTRNGLGRVEPIGPTTILTLPGAGISHCLMSVLQAASDSGSLAPYSPPKLLCSAPVKSHPPADSSPKSLFYHAWPKDGN